MLEHAGDALLVLDAAGTIVIASPPAAVLLRQPADRLAGATLTSLVDPPGRQALAAALAGAARGGHAEVDIGVGGEAHVAALHATRSSPPTIVASLAPGRPPAATDGGFERFPLGIVALEPTLEVVFSNARARYLLGESAVQPGAVLGQGSTRVLVPLAQQLVAPGARRRGTLVHTPTRALRVLGVPAARDEPALLLLEDVSRESHQERVMREFLRNAAHQLRTPLAGIAAAVETLQAGAKERPADRDRFLEHLSDHADRLTRIARGLLLLARAEAGEQLNVDVVSLAPMLAEIAAQADRRDGVSIAAECPPELAAVATRDLLRETIAALVDNATAYTETGSILVRATRAGGRTEITVSDTGPGIPVELHERIFEPFFRAGEGADGFGLGLAIAAQAVAAMHGEIRVSSTPGAGTTFTVTLPAARVEP